MSSSVSGLDIAERVLGHALHGVEASTTGTNIGNEKVGTHAPRSLRDWSILSCSCQWGNSIVYPVKPVDGVSKSSPTPNLGGACRSCWSPAMFPGRGHRHGQRGRSGGDRSRREPARYCESSFGLLRVLFNEESPPGRVATTVFSRPLRSWSRQKLDHPQQLDRFGRFPPGHMPADAACGRTGRFPLGLKTNRLKIPLR